MLTTLPEELVDRILSFSCPSTLSSLTCVCKLLQRIATPHLYTHIVLSQHSYPYIRSLALLIFTSPTHRSLVRSFTVIPSSIKRAQLAPWPAHPCLDEILRDLVERFVSNTRRTEEWFKMIRWGMLGMPLASVMVKVCPNLDVLRWEADEIGVVVRDERGLGVREEEEGWVERELQRRATVVSLRSD